MNSLRELWTQLGEKLGVVGGERFFQLAAGEVTKIEVGRSGKFTAKIGGKADLAPAHLAWTAEHFDPSKDHILKLGHVAVETSTPDYGDVVGLAHDAARDRLIASIKPTESLVEKNRKGEFRRVSMELSRTADGNFLFEHLAFLGAHRPAIAGLAPVELAAGNLVFLAAAPGDTEDEDSEPEKPTPAAILPDADEKRPLDPHGNLKLRDPEQEKTQMAEEATIKKLEDENKVKTARLIKFAEKDVEMFLASDAVVHRVPLAALKSGNARRLLAALAAMEAADEGPTVKLAAADGQETDSSLYELAKTVLLSMPEKIGKSEAEEVAKTGPEDELTPSDEARFAGADPDSVKDHMAAEKLMFAAKAKGEPITYLEALRRDEKSRK